MPIRKRNGSDIWHVDIRAPGGERIRQSTGTANRREAQEYHDKLKHELWRVGRMGERPAYTFDQAALRMLKENEHMADYPNRLAHIEHFRGFFGGRALASITRDEIFEALPEWDKRSKKPRKVSRATKNKYLATIRIMFRMAAEKWEWLDRAPKLEDLAVANRRIRWITKAEAQRLLSTITPEWLRDVAALGFATGLRRANLLCLEWSQVDLTNRRAWIHPDQAKARKPIGVPLNDDAVATIRRWIGRHERFVFVRNGSSPIPRDGWNSKQWDKQCARAGIHDFRFHDVRHTWASWHVQAGTPLNRLMELGGWAKYEHVLRYAHLAPDHLAEHAKMVTIWSQPDGDTVQTLAA